MNKLVVSLGPNEDTRQDARCVIIHGHEKLGPYYNNPAERELDCVEEVLTALEKAGVIDYKGRIDAK